MLRRDSLFFLSFLYCAELKFGFMCLCFCNCSVLSLVPGLGILKFKGMGSGAVSIGGGHF